jgi:preprotein translocase subunit SecE
MAVEVARPNLLSRVVGFYHEVMYEMRKVTWPDRAQLRQATVTIIVFVLIIAAIIGLLDVTLQAVLVRGLPALFGAR